MLHLLGLLELLGLHVVLPVLLDLFDLLGLLKILLHWVPAYEGDFKILPDPNSYDFQFTGKFLFKLKLSVILLKALPTG